MAFVESPNQAIVQIPDELVSLFSRNLTFNPEQQAALAQEQTNFERQQQLLQQQIQNQQPPPPLAANPVTYSASQHYTHSAHVAKPSNDQPQRRSSLPAVTDMVVAEIFLRKHGVDPSVLTPSQLQLFRIAHEDQQKRLIELWAICPPTGADNIASLAWSSTTVEQEEQLARQRCEKSQQEYPGTTGSLQQLNDGRWLQNTTDTEPYMVSGYESMMDEAHQNGGEYTHQTYSSNGPNYSRAMDPVYLGADYLRQQQQMQMATQYGAFEHFRGTSNANDAMDVM